MPFVDFLLNDPMQLAAWLLGLAIVLPFSWRTFNAEGYYLEPPEDGPERLPGRPGFLPPVLPSYATSKRRFRAWSLLYSASVLLSYVVASAVLSEQLADPEKIAALRTTLNGELGLWVDLLAAYPPVLTALAMPYIHANLPARINIFQWWRDFAHRQAHIPEQARALYGRLRSTPLRLTDGDRSDALRFARELGGGSGDVLTVEDFEHPQRSLYGNWARACHFLASAQRLCDRERAYDLTARRTELNYKNIREHFTVLAGEIRHHRTTGAEYQQRYLEDYSGRFLAQVCQFMVCLIVANEGTERAVRQRLRDLGLMVFHRPRYDLDPSTLLGSMILFGAGVIMVSFIMGLTYQPQPADAGGWPPARTAIASLLVVYAPVAMVFFAKPLLGARWPVRGPFSVRQFPGPHVYGFLLGCVVGAFGFAVTGGLGMLRGPWATYLPFVVLSGCAAVLAVHCIDLPARRFRAGRAFSRGLLVAGCGALAFAALGYFALLWSRSLRTGLPDPTAEVVPVLILCAAVGAILGLAVSLSSEIMSRVRGDVDELGLNVATYLEPALDRVDLDNVGAAELSDEVRARLGRMPRPFVRYLKRMEVLDDQGGVTDKGYQLLTQGGPPVPLTDDTTNFYGESEAA